jgi:asparagine synthase (glutamine-hydrolysing)
MSGFVGFIDFKKAQSERELLNSIRNLLELIKYNGQDDYRIWANEKKGLALGNCISPIIDLTKEGRHPMQSSTDRFVIAYDGEVYNLEDLKSELLKRRAKFSENSDAEVILAYIEKFDIQEAIQHFNGQFAFALWDQEKSKLYLVRDPVGIKPVYYSLNTSGLIFSSELKPIMESGMIKKEIDHESLALYLKYSNIPAPSTIIKNVYKLEPGTVFEYNLENGKHSVNHYWDPKDIIQKALAVPFTGGIEECMSALKTVINKSVAKRIVGNVPLGAFLSGGIDSSLVVATMQKLADKPVKSFAIGFREKQFNEANHAKKVAQHLGTDHTEFYVTDEDARNMIPEIPAVWDEPFADYSQIPTYLVSKLAREHVTVALTGSGGDEIFGGYIRYFTANAFWQRINKLPTYVRNGLSFMLRSIPNPAIAASYKLARPFLSNDLKFASTDAKKINRSIEMIGLNKEIDIYDRMLTQWQNPGSLVKGLGYNPLAESLKNDLPAETHIMEKMMAWDFSFQLSNVYLTKVDRASRVNTLEVRAPLLDQSVFEFAWRLPLQYKISSKGTKLILRKLLYEYVPKQLIDRPKSGFSAPVAEWLRGPLRTWATDLLSKKELDKHKLFENKIVQRALKRHLQEKENFSVRLWSLLMFQSWYNKWISN